MTEWWETFLVSILMFGIVISGHRSSETTLSWAFGWFHREKHPIRFWLTQSVWFGLGLMCLLISARIYFR
jgi:hypothetical protein